MTIFAPLKSNVQIMQSYIDLQSITARIEQESGFIEKIKEQIGHTIIGQEIMVERLLIGLLCKGHILLEGLPGLAKTLAIKVLLMQSMPLSSESSLPRTSFQPISLGR